MTAHFITSSGTGVGKTLVTAALVWQLRERGRSVRAIKPVISGFEPETATESDTGILLAALGEKVTNEAIERITPWRFAAPLAPDLAASREGRTLKLADVVGFCREAAKVAEGDGAALLIEGVGGEASSQGSISSPPYPRWRLRMPSTSGLACIPAQWSWERLAAVTTRSSWP